MFSCTGILLPLGEGVPQLHGPIYGDHQPRSKPGFTQAPWQGDRHTNHSTLSYTCTHTCPWGVGHHHGTTCTRVRARGTLACVLTSTAARCEGKGCKLLEREVTKSKEVSLLENILKVRPLGLPEQCASRCCLSSTWRWAGSDNCLILPREESVDNAWAWPRCLPGGLSR